MNPATPDAAVAIEFRDVEFRVPNGPTVLEKFSIEIERGETLVLLGRSGSGKTTALRLINRLLEPTAAQSESTAAQRSNGTPSRCAAT